MIGRACRAIPLGRAGAGQLRPGIGADAGANVELIATGNAAGRVHDDVLAHLRPFGVQVFLHAQGAAVTAQGGARAVAKTPIAQLQLGEPVGGEQGGIGG